MRGGLATPMAKEVGSRNGRCGRVDLLLADQVATTLVAVDDGDDGGRLLELLKNHRRGRALESPGASLIDGRRPKALVDLLPEAHQTRTVGPPRLGPVCVDQPDAAKLVAERRTGRVVLTCLPNQMVAWNAWRFGLGSNLAWRDWQVYATCGTRAAIAEEIVGRHDHWRRWGCVKCGCHAAPSSAVCGGPVDATPRSRDGVLFLCIHGRSRRCLAVRPFGQEGDVTDRKTDASLQYALSMGTARDGEPCRSYRTRLERVSRAVCQRAPR